MNPLLVIMAHEGVRETVERHLPFYRRAEMDMALVTSLNDSNIGEQAWVWKSAFGHRPFAHDNERIERLLRTLDQCLAGSYTHFVLIEYDTIFLRPPVIPPAGMSALARTEANWHCPWIFDYETASRIRRWAGLMLAAGVTRNGHLGYFFHTLSVLYALAVKPINGYTHVKLGPEQYPMAKEAVRNGAWVIHGIKTQEALEVCTS